MDNHRLPDLDIKEVRENIIAAKIKELRKFSHAEVTDENLRQGALIALGLKKI